MRLRAKMVATRSSSSIKIQSLASRSQLNSTQSIQNKLRLLLHDNTLRWILDLPPPHVTKCKRDGCVSRLMILNGVDKLSRLWDHNNPCNELDAKKQTRIIKPQLLSAETRMQMPLHSFSLWTPSLVPLNCCPPTLAATPVMDSLSLGPFASASPT